MKLAVAGKGGVGKTTLIALLSREAAARGFHVIAVDADPDANLATTLGMDQPPLTLSEEKDMIESRVGAGGLLKLNPTVDDIPDRYSVEAGGIRLLVLGGVRRGGGGCACPANTLLRSLLHHLLLREGEVVLVDMEAGIEHLARATAQAVDALVVVVGPDRRTLETAARIVRLAHDIGIRKIVAVGNSVRSPDEEKRIRNDLPEGVQLLAVLPYLEDLRVDGVLDASAGEPLIDQVKELYSVLEKSLVSSKA